MGGHFLLQGNVPTRGWNPCLLCLLHWQVESLPLSHLRSPIIRGLFLKPGVPNPQGHYSCPLWSVGNPATQKEVSGEENPTHLPPPPPQWKKCLRNRSLVPKTLETTALNRNKQNSGSGSSQRWLRVLPKQRICPAPPGQGTANQQALPAHCPPPLSGPAASWELWFSWCLPGSWSLRGRRRQRNYESRRA